MPVPVPMQKAKAILPKFSAFLSVCGSGFIVYDVLKSHFQVSPMKSWRKGGEGALTLQTGSKFSNSFGSRRDNDATSRRVVRKNLNNSAYYRLMLTMSLSDLMTSMAWFCTTWPIPKDDDSDVYGNVGTTQTCTAQAFFIQLGIITPFYNALLALYYFLTIRMEWKEPAFKKKVEYIGHFIAIGWGLGTAISGLVLGLYNNSVVWCWISAHPLNCDSNDDINCIRGENANVMRFVFYYIPLWVMITLVCVFMFLVFLYVRGLEQKMDSYTRAYQVAASARMQSAGDKATKVKHSRRSVLIAKMSAASGIDINEYRNRRRYERSRAVAKQGLLYAATFIATWLFGTITRLMQLANKTPSQWIFLLFAMLTPSQGFFNFVVYIRPRFIQFVKERKKKKSENNTCKLQDSCGSDILRVSGISSTNEPTNETTNDTNIKMTNSSSQQTDFDLDSNSYLTTSNRRLHSSQSKVRFVGFALEDRRAQSEDDNSMSDNFDDGENEELFGSVRSNGQSENGKEVTWETKLSQDSQEKTKAGESEPVDNMDIAKSEDNNESVRGVGVGSDSEVEESG
mmetsp:Transcript_23111/g.54574  ORF Transcript_23111/g.54574 Transcript_23111/m.54574 type:complete len:568 (+) Transcript_23111:271-1974(+)